MNSLLLLKRNLFSQVLRRFSFTSLGNKPGLEDAGIGPACCLPQHAVAEQLYSVMDGYFPQYIAPRTHHQRNSWWQTKGWIKSDWCMCCQLSRCTYVLWVKDTTTNAHYSEYPVATHTSCRQAVLSFFFSAEKAVKIFVSAR